MHTQNRGTDPLYMVLLELFGDCVDGGLDAVNMFAEKTEKENECEEAEESHGGPGITAVPL